jgi:MFS family permease
MLAGAAVAIALLAWVERRAADPIVPLALFKQRMFAVACGHGILAGFAMFGSTSFVPLFAQAVLGTSATGAGATLMPMMLGWVFASIVGSRLLLRVPYRTLAVAGMVLLTVGSAVLLLPIGPGGTLQLLIPTALMGIGMGLSIPSFLIAVQSSVERSVLGAATSTLQFSRSLGGTFGVSVMGAALAAGLASGLRAAGLDPASVSLNGLIDPLQKESAPALDTALRSALASGMQAVFLIALVAAALGLAVTWMAPRVRIGQGAAPSASPEGHLAAEPEPAPTVSAE